MVRVQGEYFECDDIKIIVKCEPRNKQQTSEYFEEDDDSKPNIKYELPQQRQKYFCKECDKSFTRQT